MNLSGVFAPIPTPFSSDESIDTGRLRAALARWVEQPLTGFVVLGSNGEAVFLTEDEADRVVAAARDAIPRSRPLIVGTGRESTAGAIDASRRAADRGADAVLVRTPAFFKSQMTTDAFVRHYTAVADASPIPVLLYNFTAVTGVNLQPAAVARLAAHPNIIGMKESGGDIAHIAEIVATTPPSFQLLAGSTTTFFAALCVGVVGAILAVSCVLPEQCRRLFDLMRAGRTEEARLLQQRLVPISRLVGPTFGVPGLKAALSIAGYDVGRPRSPLAPAPDSAVGQIRQALDEFYRADAEGVAPRGVPA
jgi:4-hydroxy-2-oxoglutarate aldolase